LGARVTVKLSVEDKAERVEEEDAAGSAGWVLSLLEELSDDGEKSARKGGGRVVGKDLVEFEVKVVFTLG
jgi:hypothetical protein